MLVHIPSMSLQPHEAERAYEKSLSGPAVHISDQSGRDSYTAIHPKQMKTESKKEFRSVYAKNRCATNKLCFVSKITGETVIQKGGGYRHRQFFEIDHTKSVRPLEQRGVLRMLTPFSL